MKEKDGAGFVAAATDTLGELRSLVTETNKLVHVSGRDVAAVIAMARDKGPGLIARIDSVAARADGILAVIDPTSIAAATDMIGPASANIDRITADMKIAMGDVREAAKRLDTVLARVDGTLKRLEYIDEPMVREFLQVQGVRVNLLPDQSVTNRIKKLREESIPLPEPQHAE